MYGVSILLDTKDRIVALSYQILKHLDNHSMDLYLIEVADVFHRVGVQQFRDGMGLRMISPCLSAFSCCGTSHAITKFFLIFGSYFIVCEIFKGHNMHSYLKVLQEQVGRISFLW